SILKALFEAHPYEEVAYDLVPLLNTNQGVGSGLIGDLATPLEEVALLQNLKKEFNLSVIKHTALLGKPIQKIAICGGSGSFLIP
ncbi:Nif3-like dinuclear metal center hexameric protein, partial [Acinetobacter baumannii]